MIAALSVEVKTSPVATVTPVHLSASYGDKTWSATLTVLPIRVASVQLDAERVAGGTPVTGTVTLSGPAPAGGAIVGLSSDYRENATVPSQVQVPEGATQAFFTVTTYPSAFERLVNIQADSPSGPDSRALTVLSDPRQAIGFNGLPGGSTAMQAVSLDTPALPGGAAVSLTSSNPDVASVPPYFTVPEHHTVGTFPVTAHPVADSTPVTITAADGGNTWSGVLVVLPAVTGSMRLSLAQVSGGATVSGSVTLSAPAPPGGMFVPLASSDPQVVSVPAGVRVPEGATSAPFIAQTAPVTSITPVTISQDVSFFADGQPSGTVTVLPAGLSPAAIPVPSS
jgi:hypothetical protein